LHISYFISLIHTSSFIPHLSYLISLHPPKYLSPLDDWKTCALLFLQLLGSGKRGSRPTLIADRIVPRWGELMIKLPAQQPHHKTPQDTTTQHNTDNNRTLSITPLLLWLNPCNLANPMVITVLQVTSTVTQLMSNQRSWAKCQRTPPSILIDCGWYSIGL
jgi:hypothetical protein